MGLQTTALGRWVLPAAGAAILGLCTGLVRAQTGAEATASKTLGVSAFAGYSLVSPDYGQFKNNGFVVGGDLTRPFRLFDPSLEVRFGYSSGKIVSENYFAAGLKAAKRYGKFNPYGDFLIGHGNINFNTPIQFSTGQYSHDDAVTYTFGGGLDYDLSSKYSVKADFQSQSWNLGSASNRLTPRIYSVAVVYHFEFGHRTRRK